jgi:hypothetical protein
VWAHNVNFFTDAHLLIGVLISKVKGGRMKKPSLHPLRFVLHVAVILPYPTRLIDQNSCSKGQKQGKRQKDTPAFCKRFEEEGGKKL